jgi:hypothetical protein
MTQWQGGAFFETNRHYYSSKISVRPVALAATAVRVGYWVRAERGHERKDADETPQTTPETA